MADEAPTPPPVGLMIQPQPALGRVVLAIMEGPLMLAHVWYSDVAQLDTIIGQLVGARVATFGAPEAPPEDKVPATERTWRCKIGDDCRCASVAGRGATPRCANFQGQTQ